MVYNKNERAFPHDPQISGYKIIYRTNEVNRCPGCHRSHWLVGRITAECGFCGTVLPLADAESSGSTTFVINGHRARPFGLAA